jgi:hypothetical protein
MRESPHSFKIELTVCVLLILGVITAWSSFFRFLDHSSGERAAFWFMRNHLGLGEPPDFVLRIAGQGIPQPLEILVTWREFQLSVLFAMALIGGLAWLAYRLWKVETQRSA